MYKSFLIFLFLVCSAPLHAESINKLAFGSCLHQNKPQFIWQSIQAQSPDLFVFMGDNIYADTTNSKVMYKKYQKLANAKEFKAFRELIPIYAVWDDHDFGQNDVGEQNPIKNESEKIFLDFFNVADDSPARQRSGIYDSHIFGSGNNSVQLILLDTRFFRGPTVEGKLNEQCPRKNYLQQLDPKVTILGDEQWRWLEKQLQIPAQVRIIVSSIQVIPDQHCWEKWSNFPLEREKLFNLIASTNANGVVFISGDRHFADVSSINIEQIGYPLYEITSSGMNTKIYGKGEQNQYRVTQDNFQTRNFGMIEFDWEASALKLQLYNDKSNQLFEKVIDIEALN